MQVVVFPAVKLSTPLLALKWAITDKFHDYLYGNTFTVIPDNNPLTYLLTTAKLDATSYRWLAALSTYNFGIKYRAGRKNLDLGNHMTNLKTIQFLMRNVNALISSDPISCPQSKMSSSNFNLIP